jgi:hypothetical protein
MTTYPTEQIEELKRYCGKVSGIAEGGGTYLLLEQLRLPNGCEPGSCDALLRPFAGAEGYPSQLYFSAQIKSPFARNWNVSNARICERNWFAFSWRVTLATPTLAHILIGHLTGFTR